MLRWSEAVHAAWKAKNARAYAAEAGAASVIVGEPLHLPWPPTGNHSVRHGNGGHYLTADAKAYRQTVAAICARHEPVRGRYRLTVHLSPPDARRRDADNALKSILDAIVKGGYVEDDAMNYMRELVVTVCDERRGLVTLKATATDPCA